MDLTYIDTFGWIGSALIIIFIYLTGKKDKVGWVVSISASVCFMIDIVLHQVMFHLIPINIILIIIAFRNYNLWDEQEKTKAYLNTPTKKEMGDTKATPIKDSVAD